MAHTRLIDGLGGTTCSVCLVLVGWLLTTDQASGGQARQTNASAVHRRVFSGAAPGAIALALKRPQDVIDVHDIPIDPNYVRGVTPEHQAQIWGCGPDSAVVVGSTRTAQVHPTEDMGELFSEWKFELSAVLRAHPDYALTAGHTATLLHRGGSAVIEGKQVRSHRYNRILLEAHRTYLLRIYRHVPETKAVVTNIEGFDLTRTDLLGSPRSLSDYPFYGLDGKKSSEIVDFFRTALAKCR
jgi:hypothetical protein